MTTQEIVRKLCDMGEELESLKMETLVDNPEFSSMGHPAFAAIAKAAKALDDAERALNYTAREET